MRSEEVTITPFETTKNKLVLTTSLVKSVLFCLQSLHKANILE